MLRVYLQNEEHKKEKHKKSHPDKLMALIFLSTPIQIFTTITMVKAPFTSELFKFAVFPNYENIIISLAETLADKEEWDFTDATKKKYVILKNYLEFTFRKLRQEKKVCFTSDNKFSCFNTGLVTENLEDIFALFEEYKNPKPGFTTPFCFKGFLKKSDIRC